MSIEDALKVIAGLAAGGVGTFLLTAWLKVKTVSQNVSAKEARDQQKLRQSSDDHAIEVYQTLIKEFHDKMNALYSKVDKLSEDHRMALEHAVRCDAELANEKRLRQESDAKIRDLNQRIVVLEKERGLK